MGDDNNVMKQLTIMMEKIDTVGSQLRSLMETVDGHTAILETQPAVRIDKKKGVLQEQGLAVKFST